MFFHGHVGGIVVPFIMTTNIVHANHISPAASGFFDENDDLFLNFSSDPSDHDNDTDSEIEMEIGNSTSTGNHSVYNKNDHENIKPYGIELEDGQSSESSSSEFDEHDDEEKQSIGEKKWEDHHHDQSHRTEKSQTEEKIDKIQELEKTNECEKKNQHQYTEEERRWMTFIEGTDSVLDKKIGNICQEILTIGNTNKENMVEENTSQKSISTGATTTERMKKHPRKKFEPEDIANKIADGYSGFDIAARTIVEWCQALGMEKQMRATVEEGMQGILETHWRTLLKLQQSGEDVNLRSWVPIAKNWLHAMMTIGASTSSLTFVTEALREISHQKNIPHELLSFSNDPIVFANITKNILNKLTEPNCTFEQHRELSDTLCELAKSGHPQYVCLMTLLYQQPSNLAAIALIDRIRVSSAFVAELDWVVHDLISVPLPNDIIDKYPKTVEACLNHSSRTYGISELYNWFSKDEPPPATLLRYSLLLDACVDELILTASSHAAYILAYAATVIDNRGTEEHELFGENLIRDSVGTIDNKLQLLATATSIETGIRRPLATIDALRSYMTSQICSVVIVRFIEQLFDEAAFYIDAYRRTPAFLQLLCDIAELWAPLSEKILSVICVLFTKSLPSLTAVASLDFKSWCAESMIQLLFTDAAELLLDFLYCNFDAIDLSLARTFLKRINDCIPSFQDSSMTHAWQRLQNHPVAIRLLSKPKQHSQSSAIVKPHAELETTKKNSKFKRLNTLTPASQRLRTKRKKATSDFNNSLVPDNESNTFPTSSVIRDATQSIQLDGGQMSDDDEQEASFEDTASLASLSNDQNLSSVDSLDKRIMSMDSTPENNQFELVKVVGDLSLDNLKIKFVGKKLAGNPIAASSSHSIKIKLRKVKSLQDSSIIVKNHFSGSIPNKNTNHGLRIESNPQQSTINDSKEAAPLDSDVANNSSTISHLPGAKRKTRRIEIS